MVLIGGVVLPIGKENMHKLMTFRRLRKIVCPAEYVSIIDMKDGRSVFIGQLANYTGTNSYRVNNIEVQPLYHDLWNKQYGLKIYVKEESEV